MKVREIIYEIEMLEDETMANMGSTCTFNEDLREAQRFLAMARMALERVVDEEE